MKKRVAILISGGGSNMVSLVDDMGEGHAAIPAIIVSNVPGAAGLEKAKARGIKTAVVDHRAFDDRRAFEVALQKALAPHAIDIVCLAGFMRILSADFIAGWSDRMLNIHPSLLPKFKGLNTHARAIAAKEDYHGCSVHVVTPALDDGPVLGQARLRVASDDTAETLAARVLRLEHQLYPAVLRRFASHDRAQVFIES